MKEEINEIIGQYSYTDNVKKRNFNFDSKTYEKNLVIFTTKASEYIENDKVILISKGLAYKLPKKAIIREMKSLWHYPPRRGLKDIKVSRKRAQLFTF